VAYFVLGKQQCWLGWWWWWWWFIAYHINENLTKADLSVSSLVCCCLFCWVNLFGLKYKILKNRSVCRVIEYSIRKAVRLVLYVGMVFVCCQLTWEWHLCVANLRGNGICVLPTYVGMAFCVANLYKNDIFVLPTYMGMTFVCCQLTWEWHFSVCHLTWEWHFCVAILHGIGILCCQLTWEWLFYVAILHGNGIFVLSTYIGMAFLCCQLT
jgi:hypothetical protein